MKPICGLDSAHRAKVMEANSVCFLRQTDALQHVQQIPAEHLLWDPPPSLGDSRERDGQSSCLHVAYIQWCAGAGSHWLTDSANCLFYTAII